MASLSEQDQHFLGSHKGLGSSQNTEVTWLEKHSYYPPHDEVDVRDFQLSCFTTREDPGGGGGQHHQPRHQQQH
jgi:hypothetical protein